MSDLSYRDFLAGKMRVAERGGLDVAEEEINPALAPHCRAIVRWAITGGCRAIFASFGLHKTSIQLELMRLVLKKVGGPVLIVLPLGVRHEFVAEAEERFSGAFALRTRFIRSPAEIDTAGDVVHLTNYETVRDGRIDPKAFVAVSLDEAAVLRGYGTKTFQTFLPLFSGVRFRFVATATPSPNRTKELIHYAGFLGVMDTGQALTRFFQRNSEKAGELTLFPHKEDEFWLWVHSWAVFLQKPSDLGFPDDGYELPEMTVAWHEVPIDHAGAGFDRDGQGMLLRNTALGVGQASAAKRDTISIRVGKVIELIRNERSGSERVSESLQGKEPGAASGGAEKAQPRILSKEPRCLQSQVQSLEGSKPGEDERASKSALHEEQGPDAGPQSGVVFSQQGPGQQTDEGREAAALRPHRDILSGDACFAEQRLCDLSRDAGGEPLCGPLPCDEEGARPAVHGLQLGDRLAEGRRRPAHQSEGLSDQIVLWCDLNSEQEALEDALKAERVSAVSLYGSQHPDVRERMIAEWKARKRSVFLTKPVMYGAGLNLQQCHTMIFCGIGFKFHDFIQAIHRVARFGQKHTVAVHIIYSEAEREVRRNLEAKWAEHDRMMARMAEIIRRYGLDSLPVDDLLQRSIGLARREAEGHGFLVANNDCVEEARLVADSSVGEIITSIPFSNHYEYTASYNDFGHTDDNDHFWRQMDYLTPELLRILMPGRLACIHVKDRILFGNVTGEGVPTVSPFHAEAIFHYLKHGFQYFGMITVVTDVVRENNQTYRLTYSEMMKDSTKMGVGSPEYILLFRKPQSDRSKGYADVPVVQPKPFVVTAEGGAEPWSDGDRRPHVPGSGYTLGRWQVDAHAFWISSGDRLLTMDEIVRLGSQAIGALFDAAFRRAVYAYEQHVALAEQLGERKALPKTFMLLDPPSGDPAVWHDVERMRTLNGEQSQRNLEKHVCPLQFDIVDRLIERYSNRGDLVYDPFGGLMTVPYRAMLKGRRGRASELSDTYFDDGVRYLRAAEAKLAVPSMFDLMGLEAAE